MNVELTSCVNCNVCFFYLLLWFSLPFIIFSISIDRTNFTSCIKFLTTPFSSSFLLRKDRWTNEKKRKNLLHADIFFLFLFFIFLSLDKEGRMQGRKKKRGMTNMRQVGWDTLLCQDRGSWPAHQLYCYTGLSSFLGATLAASVRANTTNQFSLRSIRVDQFGPGLPNQLDWRSIWGQFDPNHLPVATRFNNCGSLQSRTSNQLRWS